MHFELPSEIVARAEISMADVRLAVAVQLYSDNRIDYGDALKLSGMGEPFFDQELLSRKLSIQKYPNFRRHAAG